MRILLNTKNDNSMIRSITIKNYKGFENLKINNLAQVNLIGGDNNVGKTSLLEAIFTFFDRINPQVIFKPLLWRGMPVSIKRNKRPYEIWQAVFRNYKSENPIEFLFEYSDNQVNKVQFEIEYATISSIDPEKISKFNNSTIQQENTSEYRLHVRSFVNGDLHQDTFLYFIDGNISMKINTLKDKLPSTIFISPSVRNPAQEALRFSEIYREGLENEVLEALKIIDNRILSITPLAISEKESVIHVDIGIGKKIPLYYMGDSIVRLLEYVLAILNTQNGVVLIDEIENGLHHSKQKSIWKFLFSIARKYAVQLFATTHNKEMAVAFTDFVLDTSNGTSASYIELFRNYKTKKISANTIDADTLRYKMLNSKSFRGE